MTKALLIDVTECVGCGACAEACKKENKLPGKVGKKLDYANYTVLHEVVKDEVWVRNLCRHCLEPTCASVCPVSALHKTKEGPVVYDAHICIGCRYCMMACPFQIPKYEWHKPIPQIRKCIMCYDTRLKKGLPTACADACQNEGGGATYFGERDELLKMAHKRIKENPDNYHPFVYGEHEVGGTSTMFLLPKNVSLKKLGFRTDLPKKPLPEITWNVLEKVPAAIPVWATLLTGLWWLNNRKIEVAENNGIKPDKKKKEEGKGE